MLSSKVRVTMAFGRKYAILQKKEGDQRMANIEERLTAIEHDNAELKQKIELHTLAIGGLVNKAMLESINEKNDNIFKALTDHDQFTNQQLAELREKVEVQVEGKIVGLQTEVRQRFERQEATMNARFERQEATMNARFERPEKQLEKHSELLQQILDRLPPSLQH